MRSLGLFRSTTLKIRRAAAAPSLRIKPNLVLFGCPHNGFTNQVCCGGENYGKNRIKSTSLLHDSSKLGICPSGRPSDLQAARLAQVSLRCDEHISTGAETIETLDGGNFGDAIMQ
ncbi:hypothetical protein V6N12_031082 [Hibiscus sabdariffa]|uniref:Uncharacterized protein n=1 Tax=Hibiscus sabdariffa TaxID=183260 RepID=A0ABR2E7X0_9ROSI